MLFLPSSARPSPAGLFFFFIPMKIKTKYNTGAYTITTSHDCSLLDAQALADRLTVERPEVGSAIVQRVCYNTAIPHVEHYDLKAAS